MNNTAFCRVRTADRESQPPRKRSAVRTLQVRSDHSCRAGFIPPRPIRREQGGGINPALPMGLFSGVVLTITPYLPRFSL
jgi:hypothetical protein